MAHSNAGEADLEKSTLGPVSKRPAQRPSSDAAISPDCGDEAGTSFVSSFDDDDVKFMRVAATSKSLSPGKLKRVGNAKVHPATFPVRKHILGSSTNGRQKRAAKTLLLRQASSPARLAPVSLPNLKKKSKTTDPSESGYAAARSQWEELVASRPLRPLPQTASNVVRSPDLGDRTRSLSRTPGLKPTHVSFGPPSSASPWADADGPMLVSSPISGTASVQSRPIISTSDCRGATVVAATALSSGESRPAPVEMATRASTGPSIDSEEKDRPAQDHAVTSPSQAVNGTPFNLHAGAAPSSLLPTSARVQVERQRGPASPSNLNHKIKDKFSLRTNPPPANFDGAAKSQACANLSRPTCSELAPIDTSSLAPFSLWEYLKEEVLATDFDSTQEMKWERVTNFIAVPWWIEKIILFGFVVCLDSFLYTFTILPLRFLVALTLWLRNTLWNAFYRPGGAARRYLHSSYKCDILKTALFISSCYILSRLTDASKMYHSVRGQDVVKLYVIFNVMEIADRLCCSLGQDLLDALFSRMTLARRKDGSQPIGRLLGFFVMALFYIQAHTMVLFYQLVTLNVAINSYDNALLTLLLSNQFVEIKGSVFKKFEKENLFQLTCADIVERFQLTLILTAIGVRNLIEVSGGYGSGPTGGEVPLPRSFTVLPSISLLETSFAPVAIVLLSECLVDWLKHAFITKFNHIRPAVYGRFMDVLCRDLVVAGPAVPQEEGGRSKRRHTFVDQSPVVSRRLGFAALPLACLLVRISAQIWGMLADDSHFDECAVPTSSTRSGNSSGLLSTFMGLARLLVGSVLGVRDAQSWVENVVDSTFQILAWGLTAFVVWAFLVAVKLLLGASLVSFASLRYRTMAAREAEEDLNARDRHAIGVDRHEREYEAKAKQFLSQDEQTKTGDGVASGAGSLAAPTSGSSSKKSTGSSLMDVSRYTMVKSRLW